MDLRENKKKRIRDSKYSVTVLKKFCYKGKQRNEPVASRGRVVFYKMDFRNGP